MRWDGRRSRARGAERAALGEQALLGASCYDRFDLARVIGDASRTMAFTADQAREAQAYADQHGSTVETMRA